MTPQELKNSILQLAIQGKLVEQRPEEGTAEELYQKIKTIEDEYGGRKSAKGKSTILPITNDDIPFDIPDNWIWVRLGTIGYTNIGLTYSPKDVADKGVIVLRSSNIQEGHIDYEDIVQVNMEIPESKYCNKGDILICARNGSKRLVGKAAIIDREGMSFGAFMAIFRSPCNTYILQVINSAFFRNALLGDTGTTTINQITQEMLKNALIPLPPLAEQKRILAKIEELLPLIDRYEKAWNRLEDFNKHFPDDLQKSLLQLAIQGKLVEQRPEEGTAEELYKQIQAEKQKLIQEGKIKKEKPLPEITEEEKPFDIPESWKWCYVGEVFQHNTGKALNGSDHSGDLMTYITTSNLYWDRFELDKLKEMPFTESEVEKCTIRKGDLLVCEGGDYGRTAIWPYDQLMRIQNHIHRLRPYAPVSVRYFYYCFYLYKNSGMIAGKGIGIQGLSSNALHILKMPLPPLAEQRRIVAKIEELLPLCQKLAAC